MRPIVKPSTPMVNGQAKIVSHYREWKADLEQAIGMFCTYCGMRLNNSPQVEHVVPVNPMQGNPVGNPLAWDNVVFSCAPCNGASAKSNRHYNPVEHYMPEMHNTLLPFVYPISSSHPNQITVAVEPSLAAPQQAKAQATIQLLNLDYVDLREAKVDYRSSERWQAQQAANSAYLLYAMAKNSPTFDVNFASTYIATIAVSSGFFAIWIQTFIQEPEVLRKLIDPAFHPGTDSSSFDAITGQPQPRNPSNTLDPI